MRYMMIVTLPAGHRSEKGEMPDAATVEKMTRYNEELVKAGVLITGDGLHPTSAGYRIQCKGGKNIVTDGPFAETKEVFGGYWMIRVNSPEEALEWAKKAPIQEEVIELRRVFDMEDFPEDVQKAADSEILKGHISGT